MYSLTVGVVNLTTPVKGLIFQFRGCKKNTMAAVSGCIGFWSLNPPLPTHLFKPALLLACGLGWGVLVSVMGMSPAEIVQLSLLAVF